MLSVHKLPEKAREFGNRWLHLPFVDVWMPNKMFEEEWGTVGEELKRILREGCRIVLHCRSGILGQQLTTVQLDD